jgi:hypothetical protein
MTRSQIEIFFVALAGKLLSLPMKNDDYLEALREVRLVDYSALFGAIGAPENGMLSRSAFSSSSMSGMTQF